jgi:hypothetical protein
MTLADVRPPSVENLLGRNPVEIDLESVSEYLRHKRLLVTGAGGPSVPSFPARSMGSIRHTRTFWTGTSRAKSWCWTWAGRSGFSISPTS